MNWTRWFYRLRYLGRPPWDTGVTPPELVSVVEGGVVPPGRALDLGCGTGTNVMYLARHGFEAIGVDYVPRAIAQARRKAEEAGVEATFIVGDVTDLSFLEGPFDLVLDLGCFHGLSSEGKLGYAQGVSRLTRPGSLFLLYAWGPRRFLFRELGVTQDQVERLFAPAFRLRQASHGPGRFTGSATWYTLERV